MENMINEDGEETQDEGVHIKNEPLTFEDELTQQTRLQKRRESQRSEAYTKGYVIICNALMEIVQDLTTGAEQKDGAYWKRISGYFLDQRGLEPPKSINSN